MKNFFEKSIYAISPVYYFKLYLILFLTLISVFIELIGIGLIIPILTIFVDNDYLKYTKIFFSEEKPKEEIFRIILVLFVFVYFCKFLILRYLIHQQNELSHKMYTDLSRKIFENYLYKDFLFHVRNNSSNLIRNIQTEANIFCFHVIFPGIRLISEVVIFLSITSLLLIFNFKASLVVISFFSIVGYFLIKRTNSKLKHWGEIRQYHSSQTLKQLQQSFLSLREVIINNIQQIFLNKYHSHNLMNAFAGRNRDTTVQMPRLILELLGVTTFVVLIFFLLRLGQPISEIFVIIGVFFFAAVRLFPSITKIINSVQSLRYNNAAVDLIYNELIDFKENQISIVNKKKSDDKNKIEFKEILFKDLDFSYDQNKKKILEKINLQIEKKDKIGLIGKTGVGKTTFINLITGLLECDKGGIFIDKQNLNIIKPEWQKIIGYVPQSVSIIDENILFNVTLEHDEKKVDFEKLNEVLKTVDLYDYIFSLPKNVFEIAGERGMKLSGGQSQRIGIARALYKDPKILIFDEATNSLDETTENFILKKLFDLEDKTIITISHRDNSLKYCNKIFEIKNNSINEIKIK